MKIKYCLIAICVVFGIASLYFAARSGPVTRVLPVSTSLPIASQITSPSASLAPTNTPYKSATPTAIALPTTRPTTLPTAIPFPQQTISTKQVFLSINKAEMMSVSFNPGENHCNVLQRALEQGKITSLVMKYQPSLQSYGVYQINGIGQDDQVWWVYKINGTSPNRGCSFIEAHDGDQVLWEYLQ